MAFFKKDSETADKYEKSWLQIELSKQASASVQQISNSAVRRKVVDLNTYQEDNIKDDWTVEEKIKLENILQKMKIMKHQQKAHEVVMNLPSRMYKSFNKTKFELLNDRSHFYDERLSQEQGKAPSQIELQNRIDERPSILLQKSIIPIKQQKGKNKFVIFTQFNKQLKQSIKACFKTISVVFDYIPVIQPSSRLKLSWDFINMLIILICMFYLPITLSFNFNYSDVMPTTLLQILPSFFIFDFIINLNTGYFEKGQVVTKRSKILTKYLRKSIFTDLISILPFLISIYGELQGKVHVKLDTSHYGMEIFLKILLVPFFLKAFQLNRVLKKIEERFNLSLKMTNIIQLAKLLYTIILINHLFACLWVAVAKLEESYGLNQTWMRYNKINEKDWLGQYTAAYYFTTVTMITVGYGDILPINDFEMVICVITMMLACGVFGYSLNEIGAIFSNFYQVDNEIKKKISYIQRFMSKKNINSRLQYQIREYLEYYWREQAEQNQEYEQNIIEQLSESLRQKLLFEANKIVLKDSPIFKHNFSKIVIEQTVPLIKEIKYSPESFICLKGLQDDSAIYFIENGSVDIIMDNKQNKQQPLYSLKKGECFGAFTFFTGLPRINNVRSREFTTILMIRRADFLQLISSYTEDFERFCHIRDQISFLSDYTQIGIKCVSCNSMHHLVNDCQYLHYIPNKAKIIKCYNDLLNISQTEREQHHRRKLSASYYFRNSKVTYYEVNKQAQIFQDHYDSWINLSDDDTIFSEGYYGESDMHHSFKNSEEEAIRSGLLQNKKANVSKFGQEHSSQLAAIGYSNSKSQIYDQNNYDHEPDVHSQNYVYNNSYAKFPSMGKQQIRQRSQSELEHVMGEKKVSPSKQQFNKKKTKEMQYQETRSRSKTAKSEKHIDEEDEQSIRITIENDALSVKTAQRKSMTPDDFAKAQNQMIRKVKDNMNRSPSSKNQFVTIGDEQFQLERPHSIISQLSQQESQEQGQRQKLFKKKSNEVQKMLSQFGSKSNLKIEENNPQQDFILKCLQYLVKNQQTLYHQQTSIRETQHPLINEQFDIFIGFDKMKQFAKYNPRYNFPSVISRYNQFIDAKKKKNIKKKSERLSKLRSIQSKTLLKLQDQFMSPKKIPNLYPSSFVYENDSVKKSMNGTNKANSDLESFSTTNKNQTKMQSLIQNKFPKFTYFNYYKYRLENIDSKFNCSEFNSNQKILIHSNTNLAQVYSPFNSVRDQLKNSVLNNQRPSVIGEEFFKIQNQQEVDKSDFAGFDDLTPSLIVIPHSFEKKSSDIYYRSLKDSQNK